MPLVPNHEGVVRRATPGVIMADLTAFPRDDSADSAARRLSDYVERIIRLAGRMSPERMPAISDLEELAATSQNAAAVLRSIEEVARRRERIKALLSRLPDVSVPRGLDLMCVDDADLEQLRTFVDSLEEARIRLETSKAQLRDATDRHAFEEVLRLAVEAQNASEAEARARQQISEWLSSREVGMHREVGVHEAPPAAGEEEANSPAPPPEPAPPGTLPAPFVETGDGVGQEVEHPDVGTGGTIPPAEGKGSERPGDLTPPPPPQVLDLTPGIPPGAAVGGVEESPVQEAAPPEPPEPGTIRRALVQAIRHERLGLAAALAEVAAPGEVPGLLGASLPLAAMAMVADISGEIDDRAREATERALEALQEAPGGEETQLALVLLVPATATLAVLAPGSGQTSLLAAMVGDSSDHARQFAGLPALRDLAVKIYQSAHVAGLALNPGSDVMQALLTEEQWRQQLSEASKEISAWHSQELARQIRFAAATDVWHRMLRPGGLFHAPIQAAAQGATSRVEEVRKFIAGLDLEKVIRTTEREVRGAGASRRAPIVGPAYRELERGAEEARHRLQSWVSLVDRAPSRTGSPRGQPVAEVRSQLLERVRAAMEELPRLEGLLAAGAPCGMATLQRLLTVLDGGSPQRAAPSLDTLLGRDLAGVVGVKFGAGWSRQQPIPEAARAELIALAEAPDLPPLLESARHRIAARDFAGAELVMELAGDSEDRPKLLRELRNAFDKQRADLVHSLEAKRTFVEEAERTGRLETGPAQELTERLSRARDQVNAAAFATAAEIFAEAQRELRLAEEKLRERLELARERIIRRLNLLRQVRDPERERVENLLRSGQFALAEDLVERLEAGESLEAPLPIPVGDAFSTFFPAGAERLASWLRGRRTAMRDIADGTLTVPPDLLAGGMEITPDLRDLAEAWADCVRENSRNALRDALIRLFSAFGFTDPELPGFATPAKKVTEATLQLRVRPLRERETAVLPQFGSEANGVYRLLCLWQKRDAEDISQALAALPSSSAPTIVLFFNPLDQEQRRRLAALAREPPRVCRRLFGLGHAARAVSSIWA